nr:family 43 glycosylhydrolase [Pedobacter glucosidilyticus]
MKSICLKLAFICLSSCVMAQELKQNIPVHDPVLIKQDSVYYLFCTGRGIGNWSSKDLKNWKKEEAIFNEAPEWAVKAVPGFKNHIWAPDISYHQGKYYLYYSISAFGKNTSCIGLAVNTTLHPQDSNYKWVDMGKVIQSYPSKTNWNAIDPNLVTDDRGRAYLSFGSFWEGLKLVKLKKDRFTLDEDVNKLATIATRVKKPGKDNLPAVDDNPKDAGGNAIEAPFIFKKGTWYYLFASTDYCCKGPKSTYKMIVGRSKNVKGPYLDKDGVSLANGGGTLLLAGNENWNGVGHNAVFYDEKSNTDYLVFHGYDAQDKGISKLRIEKLKWINSWPEVE